MEDEFTQYQDTTKKKREDTEKTKLIQRDINKLQSETKETIKKERYEIKKTTQYMKEKFCKTSEKNQTETMEVKISLNQIKNTGESHSSRLEQVEQET
jgi:hypothetical protein